MSAWSNLANGTSCGTDEYCFSGACSAAGCDIGGTFYATGTLNGSCQSCQPSVSMSGWSNLANGTSCGTDEYCFSGACSAAGCDIGGTFYATGTLNGTCQSCQPSVSMSGWSNLANGTSCGTDEYCFSGACSAQGCDIGGTFYATGTLNGTCQSCQPSVSTTGWSNLANGTSCGTDEYCFSGACSAQGCDIGGTFYATGTTNGPCQVCQPSSSTSSWTNVANGTSCNTNSCETGMTCSAGSCQGGTSLQATVSVNSSCSGVNMVATYTATTSGWVQVYNYNSTCGYVPGALMSVTSGTTWTVTEYNHMLCPAGESWCPGSANGCSLNWFCESLHGYDGTDYPCSASVLNQDDCLGSSANDTCVCQSGGYWWVSTSGSFANGACP